MTIKKYIEIPEEALNRINAGKFVEGSLHRNKKTKSIVFNLHKEDTRKSHKRKPDRLLIETDHGWVKESPNRIKYYCAVKKALGVAKISAIMEHDQKLAMSELIGLKLKEYMNLTDQEIIDRV